MPFDCEVIVDIAHADVDRLFSYAIPDELSVCVGQRVLVPFGSGMKPREGFVLRVYDRGERPVSDPPIRYKSVVRTLEPYAALIPEQIALALWLKKSYNCLLADAFRLMLPAEMRGGRVKERVERTIKLADPERADEWLAAMLDQSGKPRAPRQYELLETLKRCGGGALSVSDLYALVPHAQSALSQLLQKGYVCEQGAVTFRRPRVLTPANHSRVTLSKPQKDAVDAIFTAMMQGGGTLLLHGVTGSGKTEVYMHAIERCLTSGRQAIMLVPEISLTPQTVGLFTERFDDTVAVLHSGLSAGERFDEWRRIRLGKARVVVGARSAIFAPMENVGLIVVDEEHENSYLSEITPRYNAVDVAAYRAKLSRAALVLGSATPSLLTYYRAQSGRYKLLTLAERVQSRPLPKVEVVDMRDEFLCGNNGIFSARLTELLTAEYEAGRQAMLFLNRRGYSTFVCCRACGYVVTCDNCDVSMTFHKGENRLRCHFCGAVKPLPVVCPQCGKPFIKQFGVGTEQVEEQLKKHFPEAKILRMDTDTTRTKDAILNMLSAFGRGEAQFLVGTQMIAKGHDFPNVTLVGVVAADSALRIPDYRSTERTFQLLTQVAGRAGRNELPGTVVIQTYAPNHPAIRFAREHDYESFFAFELQQRRKALFPPFSVFVRILFSDVDDEKLRADGKQYAQALEKELGAYLGEAGKRDLLLFSAADAPIRKKQGQYRFQILMKLLRTERVGGAIKTIYSFANAHRGTLYAMVEVNPQDML